jgi:CheY-like chemotaxis protein
MARILFVDDDPFTLETLSKAAEVLGHQAILAHTGQEALKLASKESPDLIFIDMRLPDTDGVALISALKSKKKIAKIPMFMLSASPAEDVVERSTAAGARAYIDKPIRLQTLLEIIEEYASK